MEKIETVLINNEKYGILKEVEGKEFVYVFLASIENPKNQIIRKYESKNKNVFIPLDSADEVKYAFSLFEI